MAATARTPASAEGDAPSRRLLVGLTFAYGLGLPLTTLLALSALAAAVTVVQEDGVGWEGGVAVLAALMLTAVPVVLAVTMVRMWRARRRGDHRRARHVALLPLPLYVVALGLAAYLWFT